MLKRKNLRIWAAVAIVVLLLGVMSAVIFSAPAGLVVSEVCAAGGGQNGAELRDCEGELCDWVEIYNPTNRKVSLKRYSLSREDGKEFRISGGTVPAGGYALVYCTKNGFEDSSVSWASFRIPKAESCTLSLKSGRRLVDSISLEPTRGGMTVCAGETGAYISTPTPCAENSAVAIPSQIVFSQESGFYADAFPLTLTSENSAAVYYTLDGTDPRTSDTARIYAAPIVVKDRSGEPNALSAKDPMEIQLQHREGRVDTPGDEDVDKGTVIRACGKNPDGQWGLVGTATYFVGLTTADHSDMPVISLVTSPDALYDRETGIYVRGKVYEDYYPTNPNHRYNGSVPANYNQRGREWERECTIQFFESDGSLQFTQDAGMRIQGGWSRADYQKSFRFYARSDYGKDSFDCRFWEGLTVADGEKDDSFSTFVMRNGGNASNFLKYKDIMMQELASELDVPTQTGRPCVLFIDGEYWGYYILQDDYSQEYFAKRCGVAEESVAVYKNGLLDEGLAVDELSFNNMRDFIVGYDMSKEENYQRACELLDMDNFIDYCAAEMYIFNDDWPQNNYGCWRSTDGSEYGDGRWRFFLFDTESCAFHYEAKPSSYSYFDDYLESKKGHALTKMIFSLLENDGFRTRLITRLMDMGNIVYESGRTAVRSREYREEYLPEMRAYYRRFNTHRTVDVSLSPMADRMDEFFSGRRDNLSYHARRYFGLGRPREITVTAGEGIRLTLNGLSIESGFSGEYFPKSELTLTADREVSWRVTEDGETTAHEGKSLTVTVKADTVVEVLS